MEQLKRNVELKNSLFFEDTPAVRPRSELVRTTLASQVRELASRFLHYNVGGYVRLTEGRIRASLDQFPERLVAPMVTVLENVQFVDRDQYGARLAQYLERDANENTCFVPISKPLNKSAPHLGYYMYDLPGARTPVYLNDALERDPLGITFFDDCLISGSQATATIQTWFGMPTGLDEYVADSLSSEDKERLARGDVRFRFLYGTDAGISSVRKLAGHVGLTTDVAKLNTLTTKPRSLDAVLSEEEAGRLRTFLSDVGQSLLESTKAKQNPEKWTTERCREFSLGYGDSEQLLVFAYNTPTATITALWKGGVYRGARWLPLFPRRLEVSPPLSQDS
ncbi:MAG: phosphoribosyltransferase-like protein [Planctomycetota bacterium]